MHKYLKPAVFEDLCDSILEKSCELSSSVKINEMAEKTSTKFKTLNMKFSKVHVAISHGRRIDGAEVANLKKLLTEYMTFFRQHFRRVLPKMHMLEEHVLPWIERWGFGMAMHGEQGGESIHAEYNEQKVIARGIIGETHKIESMMKNHLTKCMPSLQRLVQPTKKKVKHVA